jgi:WD40 repeat protein
MYSYQVTDY